MNSTLENRIFGSKSPKNSQIWRELFDFQRRHNPVYGQWCDLMGFPLDKPAPDDWREVPFLPISMFKQHRVYTASTQPEVSFFSSSTTGQGQSQHAVADLSLYRRAFQQGFEHFFGPANEYALMALLPSYLEREGSSLVYMVEQLMDQAQAPKGFYLHDHSALLEGLAEAEGRGIKTLLWGVSFALLQLAEAYQGPPLQHTQIIETGGMKGRGPEMTRAALHAALQASFGPKPIASEYGMTELLSQAYSLSHGRFFTGPTLELHIQDPSDPKNWLGHERSGRVCAIDYANVYSCSFIATDDLGRSHSDGSLEILGRLDHSEIRGCNQLAL
ncbi:MAG: acyl transferase [Bacteroidia bacterium]